MKIPFTKMVGAGNDFLLVDARRLGLSRLPWRRVSQTLCDRRRGVGADGLLVLERSRSADVRMRVFNPDGSEAEMCGNGARCVALYLRETGDRGQETGDRKLRRARRVTIETEAGVLSGRVRGEWVAMRMTDPTNLTLGLAVPVSGRRLRLGCVNTGVPHAVVRVSALDRVDVLGLGRALRCHRRFAPCGTNVDFIQPAGRAGRLRIRTYERGVEGETLACGTGVAASAIIHTLSRPGRVNGQARRHRVDVETRSGDHLAVSFHVVPTPGGPPRVSDVTLEGTARYVFEGTARWPHHLFERRAYAHRCRPLGRQRPLGRRPSGSAKEVVGWPVERRE